MSDERLSEIRRLLAADETAYYPSQLKRGYRTIDDRRDLLDEVERLRQQLANAEGRHEADDRNLASRLDDLNRARNECALAEKAAESLRQQLAAARQDGERLEDLAAAAIYRLSEGAHHWATDQAYGLAPVTTDFGEDIGRLREALGITVTHSAADGYVFTRSDAARSEPSGEES
ncbi:MAG TPA: hypothetical protein VFK04_12865 [Gemmatimonadaceae bacterium]|nr:hypothetical protein [Gemmatimonadaceae bacterium]